MIEEIEEWLASRPRAKGWLTEMRKELWKFTRIF